MARDVPLPIEIHVHTADQPNGEKEGTFTLPHPLVKVYPGQMVEWKLTGHPNNSTFIVQFIGLSPIPGVPTITQATGALAASASGDYHYQVQVTDGGNGKTYSILSSPELGVGN
jgi:hypothetical protein